MANADSCLCSRLCLFQCHNLHNDTRTPIFSADSPTCTVIRLGREAHYSTEYLPSQKRPSIIQSTNQPSNHPMDCASLATPKAHPGGGFKTTTGRFFSVPHLRLCAPMPAVEGGGAILKLTKREAATPATVLAHVGQVL